MKLRERSTFDFHEIVVVLKVCKKLNFALPHVDLFFALVDHVFDSNDFTCDDASPNRSKSATT